MTLKCGIVGLPNVGKSTLFNALTGTIKAEAANYPFCTIEPNSGIVSVPDKRIEELAKLAGSAKTIPAYIEFVDIAGLVKGASSGEGLGNKFLSHIREVDAIIHVVRCFEDGNITHVNGKIDPIDDAEVINTELIIADLESCDKRIQTLEKKVKSGDKEAKELQSALARSRELLNESKPVRSITHEFEPHIVKQLSLITAKPVLYVANVAESDAASGNDLAEKLANYTKEHNSKMVIISSRIEEEISLLETNEEKHEFLSDLGLTETGLSKIIQSAYSLLNLKSFFTIGPKEAHAWTFNQGAHAPAAAGIIHTDFEKGFIRAEIISYKDYIECKTESRAKELGLMRLEGKDYVMQDGDIVHFRFNV